MLDQLTEHSWSAPMSSACCVPFGNPPARDAVSLGTGDCVSRTCSPGAGLEEVYLCKEVATEASICWLPLQSTETRRAVVQTLSWCAMRTEAGGGQGRWCRAEAVYVQLARAIPLAAAPMTQ